MSYRLYGKLKHTHRGKIAILAITLAGKGCAAVSSHTTFSWKPSPPTNMAIMHCTHTHTHTHTYKGGGINQNWTTYRLDVYVCNECTHESEWVCVCVCVCVLIHKVSMSLYVYVILWSTLTAVRSLSMLGNSKRVHRHSWTHPQKNITSQLYKITASLLKLKFLPFYANFGLAQKERERFHCISAWFFIHLKLGNKIWLFYIM